MDETVFARGIGLLVAQMQEGVGQQPSEEVAAYWATWILDIGTQAVKGEVGDHPDEEGFLERVRSQHEQERAMRRGDKMTAAAQMATAEDEEAQDG